MQQNDVEMSDSEASEEVATTIGGQSVQGYVTDLFSNVITGLQRANELPQGDDYEFYESFRNFPKHMNEYAASLSKMLSKVSETYSRGNIAKWKSDEELRELVDDLLEGIDDDLDAIKSEAAAKKMSTEEKIRKKQLMKAVQAVRPQNNFKVKPDNSTEPFRPFTQYNSNSVDYYPPGTHPYERQIKEFTVKPWQLLPPETNPPVYQEPEEVECAYIDKPKQLENLAKELLKEREFAVDLEHHSMHSFQGFVCLMQISTRSKDYIIDALELRSHMWRLSPSFANENIMKVFHGGSSDIEWLQRDFGIYVINMFDTGAAAQQLAIPHGLGKTLGHFGIHLDKRYQTADWRQRPLTADMLKYARLDTHYLLWLADHLRLQLMSQGPRGGIQNPLKHVFEESKQLCLRKYVKPTIEDDEMRLMGRIDQGTRSRHADALKSILRWRDEIARLEDESYTAVLHSATCTSLAEELSRMDITKGNICRLFTPTPRLLQKHVNRLLEVLKEDSITGQAPQGAKKDEKTVAVAEIAGEAGWNVEGDDEDLWDLDKADEQVVKVLRSDPSKLYDAIRTHVERTMDKREQVVEHFNVHRNEVLKQQAEAGGAAIPVAVPTKPTQGGIAPHIVPQQNNLSGDIIKFSSGAQASKPKKQKATQAAPVTSLRERESEDKKRRQAAGGDKKAKLPHLESTQLMDTTSSDVFLKNIGWERPDTETAKPPQQQQWKKPVRNRSGQAPAQPTMPMVPNPHHAYQYTQQAPQHPQPIPANYSQPVPQQQSQYPSYHFPITHTSAWSQFPPANPQMQPASFMQQYTGPAGPSYDALYQPRRMSQ